MAQTPTAFDRAVGNPCGRCHCPAPEVAYRQCRRKQKESPNKCANVARRRVTNRALGSTPKACGVNSRRLLEFRNQAGCDAIAASGATARSRSRRKIAFNLPPSSKSKQV